jgi:carboxymethylenebutenolidase
MTRTETEGAFLNTETLALETPDGTMPLYEARPDDAKGAVIVIQEAFGVNDHIEDVTRRFADAGYHAVAPNLFHRAGGGTAPYDDFAKVMPLYEKLDDDGILTDLDAAREHLHQAGWTDTQIGIVGFCFGGRVTFLAGLRRQLGAAVGFYGGGIVTQRFPQFPALVDEAATLQAPWLGLFGEEDHTIPVEDLEQLRKALQGASVETDVVLYPNSGHAFHNDQRKDVYRDAEAKDAWNRTLGWFEHHLRTSSG